MKAAIVVFATTHAYIKRMTVVRSTPEGLRDEIARAGFAYVKGDAMRGMLAEFGSLSDWAALAASWDDLDVDTYMADRGRYRRRRHAVYAAEREGAVRRAPDRPHFQSKDYNPLHGGIARRFEPIVPAIGSGPAILTILSFCRALFGRCVPTIAAWDIEVHQFRIEARAGEKGLPTPEGVHRDGVDYVLVLLIDRHNIASGTTTIHDPNHRLLGSFVLTDPFDAALVDDARVQHGVTAVEPLDPRHPAHRDVLVVTFRQAAVAVRL